MSSSSETQPRQPLREASLPPLAAIAVKEMVNAAFETGLAQGVNFERRLFHGLVGTEDQKEGMAAVVEKRPWNWTGRGGYQPIPSKG